MKIILDAMGGDNAPIAIIDGALTAMSEFSDIEIVFSGKEDVIKKHLNGKDYDSSRISIINADEIIEMCDVPTVAIRKKKNSSMVEGFNALIRGEGDIFISAGNTGALVAGGTLLVKRAKGVKRPALATQFPTKTGSVLLIDAGANADCKPGYLQQFGIMGSIYMNKVMNVDNPKVGLINNGGEEEKGSALTKEAYRLMKASHYNFVGNAEGRDLLSGNFDVVVTDGFTGNIILKFLEGTAKTFMDELKQGLMKNFATKLGAMLVKGSLMGFKKKFDYKEYGGALLLGLNSGVMKAHGSSDAKAISSAVKMARKFILGNVVEEIKSGIEIMTAESADE